MGVLSTKRARVFVSTPPGEDFESLREQLTATLVRAGLEVVRFDRYASARSSTEQAREELRQSNFFIADLTGSDSNVVYEVGIAHGVGLPVFLLTQGLSLATPAFLQDNVFLLYKPGNISAVLGRVVGWLQSEISQRVGPSR